MSFSPPEAGLTTLDWGLSILVLEDQHACRAGHMGRGHRGARGPRLDGVFLDEDHRPASPAGSPDVQGLGHGDVDIMTHRVTVM